MASNESSKEDLRSHLHSVQKEFQTSNHTPEVLIKFLNEPLDFLENGNSWNGPSPTPQLQSFFLKKLYAKHLNFIIENVIYEGFYAHTRSLQDKLVAEYFVPTGEKTGQKVRRASISLRVLVTHFSLSEVDRRQQGAHLLKLIQKLLISLLDAYTFEDLYEAIMNNAETSQSEKRAEWMEFVNLICSLPERSANLMMLSEYQRRDVRPQEETTNLDDFWGYLQRRPGEDDDDTPRLGISAVYSKPSYLLGPTQRLSNTDPLQTRFVNLTSAILIIFGYLPKETLIKAAIPREITLGVTQWLQSSSEGTRRLGMVTAEMLSKLIDEPENVLNFDMASGDEEIEYLRKLVEVKDGIADLQVAEENFLEESYETEEFLEDTEPNKADEKILEPLDTDIDSNIATMVNEQDTAAMADSDDDDDFEPYPMEAESESEDDGEAIPQTKGKKVLAPVYIIDLISYLRSNEDPEKIEIAINNAARLIRNKMGFGMELDDNAKELAGILLSLQDNFSLKGFEENRQNALTALSCGSPKIVVPYLVQQLFETRYSLSDKFMTLSVLSSAAKELAGMQTQEDVSDNKKYIDDTLSAKFDDLSVSTLKIPATNVKENRFSRRPQLEFLRTYNVSLSNEAFYLDLSVPFNISSPSWVDLTSIASIPYYSAWATSSLGGT
ncbi:9088_t:CDS:10, partial [Acaulospora colombiana]